MQIDLDKNPELRTAFIERLKNEYAGLSAAFFLHDMLLKGEQFKTAQLEQRLAQIIGDSDKRVSDLVEANTRLNGENRALLAERNEMLCRPKAPDPAPGAKPARSKK